MLLTRCDCVELICRFALQTFAAVDRLARMKAIPIPRTVASAVARMDSAGDTARLRKRVSANIAQRMQSMFNPQARSTRAAVATALRRRNGRRLVKAALRACATTTSPVRQALNSSSTLTRSASRDARRVRRSIWRSKRRAT